IELPNLRAASIIGTDFFVKKPRGLIALTTRVLSCCHDFRRSSSLGYWARKLDQTRRPRLSETCCERPITIKTLYGLRFGPSLLHMTGSRKNSLYRSRSSSMAFRNNELSELGFSVRTFV